MKPDLAACAQKAALRQAARARRRSLSLNARRDFERCVLAHFTAAAMAGRLPLTPGGCVAGYRAIGAEFDGGLLLAWLAARGFPLALPMVVAQAAPLVFRHWRLGDRLAPDPILGMPGPAADQPLRSPDLLLVPVVAFDGQGGRLGQGGGYYDRTLAVLRAARGATPLLAIGVGYGCQEEAALPCSPHDQRLDGMVTEHGFRMFSRQG